MALTGELVDATSGDTLYVGADHSVPMTIYQSDGVTPQDITGWTIVLDIRKKDTSSAALLSSTAALTTPASGICTFTLSATDLSASVFTGDDWRGRYSVWRTDSGSKQPLRSGDVTIKRTTRT